MQKFMNQIHIFNVKNVIKRAKRVEYWNEKGYLIFCEQLILQGIILLYKKDIAIL
jgi:hypothetical protein